PMLVAVYSAIAIISAFFFLPVTGLVIGVVPPARAGEAAGISQTSQELGGALGIALLGSIVTAIYRGSMATGLPGGLTPDAANTARDTLAGAVGVAASLPGSLSASFLDGAHGAFLDGFHVAAIVSAVISSALAGLA